jgi:hypothetical protein
VPVNGQSLTNPAGPPEGGHYRWISSDIETASKE